MFGVKDAWRVWVFGPLSHGIRVGANPPWDSLPVANGHIVDAYAAARTAAG